MKKNIFKEIVIILLLILAIILILGVLLYEYVPTNKIIPDQISYTTPENVKTELESSASSENDEVVMKYSIDATDLQNYKKVKEYVSGKSNPFASVKNDSETETNTTSSEGTNTTTSGNTTTTNSSTTNSSTQNTENNTTGYIPDKGTK
jgi:flagellar basal body-associated protein FliL